MFSCILDGIVVTSHIELSSKRHGVCFIILPLMECCTNYMVGFVMLPGPGYLVLSF